MTRAGSSAAATPRWRRWLLPCAVAALWSLSGCAASAPHPPRAVTYAYPVHFGETFDLRLGRAVPDDALVDKLAGVRMLFLGEHHTEPGSHAFQADLIDRLAATGRPLVVALEMFPPASDPALEDWRQGRLDEETFLEQSGWYTHWRFPWAYYRELFLRLREHRIPVHGVNASAEERAAVRADKPDDLPEEVRTLMEPLDARVPPHQAYLADVLYRAGHGDGFEPDSERFQRYYRVQRLWDRLMGVRTARLAAALPADGLAILIVGSGHVAYGLGANLQAVREHDLPSLSLWDTVATYHDLDADGHYPAPIGIADWVRVYRRADPPVQYPSLISLKLAQAPEGEAGVLVEAVRAGSHSPLRALRKDDLVHSLNDKPVTTPTALRLAFEQLPSDATARFGVDRGGERIEIEIDVSAGGL